MCDTVYNVLLVNSDVSRSTKSDEKQVARSLLSLSRLAECSRVQVARTRTTTGSDKELFALLQELVGATRQ